MERRPNGARDLANFILHHNLRVFQFYLAFQFLRYALLFHPHLGKGRHHLELQLSLLFVTSTSPCTSTPCSWGSNMENPHSFK